MGQQEKLIEEFAACRGPYSFRSFLKVLAALHFTEVKTGRTGGSRRRYVGPGDRIILFHEPHDDEMGPGTVKAMQEQLGLQR